MDVWLQIEILELTRDQAGCGRLAMFASRAHLIFQGDVGRPRKVRRDWPAIKVGDGSDGV